MSGQPGGISQEKEADEDVQKIADQVQVSWSENPRNCIEAILILICSYSTDSSFSGRERRKEVRRVYSSEVLYTSGGWSQLLH